MFKNKNLLILALVMIVNALSYGILIPLLYPYASRFGLSAAGLGMLFASYSLFQFLATPIMGRYSDRFGRKPMLVLSLLGTAGSLALFALANSVPMLFLARILDGITGGNNSVAQAVIADTTTGEQRIKSFGIIGASYGLGFMIGPALGGLLSRYGLTVPFWVASGIALIAAVIASSVLKETNTKKHEARVAKEGLFNFGRIFAALSTPTVGIILIITFLISSAHSAYVVGFQSFSVDILKLSPQSISFIFTFLGLVLIFMQSIGIRFLLKTLKSAEKLLQLSLLASILLMLVMIFKSSVSIFVFLNIIYMISFAPLMVVNSSLISKKTKAEDQGGILGINQSYLSLGQIAGPLLAGLISAFSTPAVFLSSALMLAMGLSMSFRLVKGKKADL